MSTTTIEKMRAQLRTLFQRYNDHDVDGIMAMFTDDVVWEDPNIEEPVIGKEAAAELVRSEFVAFPDLHFPTEEIMFFTAPDGKAASRWHAVGTMTGRLDPPGYLATGKTAGWTGMCYYEFRDGLIARHSMVFDTLGVTQALGLMPSTESLVTKTLVGVTNVGNRLSRVLHR